MSLIRVTGLLALTSHTHKRGERFFMSVKGGEQIYESFTYDEPLYKRFEPALVLIAAIRHSAPWSGVPLTIMA